MKRKINVDNVERLFEKKSSKQVMFHALKLLKPSKKNIVSFIIIILIGILPAGLISYSIDTIKMTKAAIEVIGGVVLALFGIAFTGYAFFQALINKELLIWMLEDDKDNKDNKDKDDKSKSRLQNMNEYFAEVMMLQGLSIFISLIVRVILIALPENWAATNFNLLNIIISLIVLSFYFSFNFLTVWELKSFIFNIFQLFNAHAGAKVLSMFKDDNEDI